MKLFLTLASLLALSISSVLAADLVDAGGDFHQTKNLITTAGDSGTFLHRLLNIGGGNVALVDVNYYLSADDKLDGGDVQVGSEKVGPIEAGNPEGARAPLDFQFPVTLAAGDYYLLWEFPLAGDEETRDNFGAFDSQFTVRAPADFDLRPHNANAYVGGGGSYDAGTTFLAVAQATNDGPDRSSGFTADWYLSTDLGIGSPDDIFLANTVQSSIAAPKANNFYGEVATNLTIPADTAPGTYNLGFRLNAARDNFPANNTYSFATQITVVDSTPGNVDLTNVASSFGLETQFPAFDTHLPVNARVRNIGDTESGAFTVKYYATENLQVGDGDDVALATEDFDGILAAPLGASTFPTRTIDTDLPMSGLSVGTPYYLYYVISGGDDDNNGNNTNLLTTRFIPSTRPDLELRDFRIRDYEGNDITSFPAGVKGFPFRFSGTIENHSSRETTCQLAVTFNQQNSSRARTCIIRFYTGDRRTNAEPAIIPANSVQEFNTIANAFYISNRTIGRNFLFEEECESPPTLLPYDVDNPYGYISGSSEWTGSLFTYDVTAEIAQFEGDQAVPDATPADNDASAIIAGRRFNGVNLSMSSVYGEWTIEYDFLGYPTLSAPIRVSRRQGPDSSFRLQFFANGVPFGDPTEPITLSRYEAIETTMSRQLPSSFPPGSTEFSIGIVQEPGSPEDPTPFANCWVFPDLVEVGNGNSLLPDLTDDPAGFRSVPDAINPGTGSSPLLFPIKNIGLTDAPPSRVSIFLSEDSNINANTDTLIGEVPVPAIPRGLVHDMEMLVSAPDSVEPGFYYIGWQLNSSLDFVEATLANNSVAMARRVQVGTFVNLAPGDQQTDPFTLSLDYAAPGDVVVLEGGQRNGGNITSGEYQDAIVLSTDPLFRDRDETVEIIDYPSLTKPPLPPYTDRPLDVTFALPFDLPTGTYFVRYVIDYRNSIAETSEHDNIVEVGVISVNGTGEAPPPEIVTMRILDKDSVFLRFTSRADRSYRIALSSDLTGPWLVDPNQPLIPGTGFIVPTAFHDLEPQLSAPAQFFRIEEVDP